MSIYHWTGPPGRERGSRPAGDRAASLEKSGNCNTVGYSGSGSDRQPVALAELKFYRNVERLHRLGPRVLAEFLTELGCDFLIRTAIETRLARYTSRLSPQLLRAAGADCLLPTPLHLVEADR